MESGLSSHVEAKALFLMHLCGHINMLAKLHARTPTRRLVLLKDINITLLKIGRANAKLTAIDQAVRPTICFDRKMTPKTQISPAQSQHGWSRDSFHTRLCESLNSTRLDARKFPVRDFTLMGLNVKWMWQLSSLAAL